MLKKINTNALVLGGIEKNRLKIVKFNINNFMLSSLIFKDMMFYIKVWRQIKGYSSNGQRSHSNNKGNKKNKLLLSYRVKQFYALFGRKKRNIFPTLIIAEYNNRLWKIMWHLQWTEASIFILTLALKGKGRVKFDPQLTSKNIVTGVKTKKKKKKHNTAKKKILSVATIGLPILFSFYLYNNVIDKQVPYKLTIPDDSRRKMGKKTKKNKKKK